jgi:TrmH family RNA methyltransferase
MLERLDVCLVETANAENLGAIARLAENFGLASALLLIAPRVAPTEERALVVGRAARGRLEGARVVGTVEEAVGEASLVVGLSARRGAERPSVGLRELASFIAARAPRGRVALLFGPESTGLRAEHVDRCDVVATIETPGPLASLNLAQAVALVLWELSRPSSAPITNATRGGATRGELEALLDHAFEALEAVGYFREVDRAQKRVHLRRVLGAAALTSDEVRGLHGLCTQIVRAVRGANAKNV